MARRLGIKWKAVTGVSVGLIAAAVLLPPEPIAWSEEWTADRRDEMQLELVREIGSIRDMIEHPKTVEGMVAERDDIGSGVQKALGMVWRDAGPGGGILSVHDREIDLEAILQGGKPFGDGAASGAAHHVSEIEQFHGLALIRAGGVRKGIGRGEGARGVG